MFVFDLGFGMGEYKLGVR